jgi:hypothetical protein
VTSNVDADDGKIVGFAYVAAFAPEAGESAMTLSSMLPGSTLGDALQPIPRADGTTGLTIRMDRFQDQFAADLAAARSARVAVTRAARHARCPRRALGEHPLWKELPSWCVFGDEGRNMPAAVQHDVAKRAGARGIVEIPGGVSRGHRVAPRRDGSADPSTPRRTESS